MINILPEFESRQVLTSDELNWLTCYLDTQNRQTRRLLIGCGLISGLQVQLKNNSVQISNGLGLTSAGHIVQLFRAGASQITYTKTKPYKLDVHQTMAFHYLSDIDPQANDYSGSTFTSSLYSFLQNGEVAELMEDTENGGTAIQAAALQGKVVMLFAEIVQHELKNCEDDNCQERGKKYHFNIKPLVVSKDDALLLLNDEYKVTGATETGISRLAFPWLHLPALEILKPVFSNRPGSGAYGEKVIAAEYSRCISDFIQTLSEKKELIDSTLNDLQSYCSLPTDSIKVTNELYAKVSTLKVINSDGEPLPNYQLIYDFLWGFIKAYKELQLDAQYLRSKVTSREDAFPQHIFLGLLQTTNIEIEWPVGQDISVFRHAFQSRHTQIQQAELVRNISIYLKRLGLWLSSFDDNVLGTLEQPVKINVGGDIHDKLSCQSIPYYFKEDAFNFWSAHSYHPVLQSQVTAYNKINSSQPSTSRAAYHSLPTALQSNNAFYRIEGVYNQTANTALESVFQLRKAHGLAFEVLLLRVNEKAPFNHTANSSVNEDLESLYQVTRAELLKLIQFTTGYLSFQLLKFDKMKPTENMLINELRFDFLGSLRHFNVNLLNIPITEKLENAIKANNIFTSNKFVKVDAGQEDEEVEFKELKVLAYKTRLESGNLAYSNIKPATVISKFLPGIGIRLPNYNFPIFLLNTFGTLINNVRSNSLFSASTDISFYTRLLAVAKKLQKEGKQRLFMLCLQLYCALKIQEALLDDEFTELDIDKYQKNLDNELLMACASMQAYLKGVNSDPVKEDEILDEIIKKDMIDHTDRIRFDDDWVKVVQLMLENRKRNGGLGIENLLERFIQFHPGISHGCGVPRGGTYIMVYNEGFRIAADFYLPYIISSTLRPLQFTFVERSTLTISGFVKNKDGDKEPIAATILVGNSTVVTNKEGFYSALVNADKDVEIICQAQGFVTLKKIVKVTGDSVTENFDMVAEAVNEFTLSVKFVDAKGKKIQKNINLVNTKIQEPLIAKEGEFKLKGKVGDQTGFVIKDDFLEPKEFTVEIGSQDSEREIELIVTDLIRIHLVVEGRPFNSELLDAIGLTDPIMDVEAVDVRKGIYLSKGRVDLLKPAKLEINYNGVESVADVDAGEAGNEVILPAGIEPIKLEAGVVVGYKGQLIPRRRDIPRGRIDTISINKTIIEIDQRTNAGIGKIETKGSIKLGDEFVNAPVFRLEDPDNTAGCVFIVSGDIINDKVNIAGTGASLSMTRTLKEEQIKLLIRMKPEIGFLARKMDLTKSHFYCFILPSEEIVKLTEIFRL